MPAAAPVDLLARLRAERPDLSWSAWNGPNPASRRAAAKSRVAVVRGSVNALPFADASFDAAIAADVLCHRAVEPPTRRWPNCAACCAPAGGSMVNMPAYAWLLSAHDRLVHNVRRQTAAQLAALLRDSGFGQVRARYWNGLLLPLMVVQRKLLGRAAAASDVAPFPPWLDATFHGMTEFERHLPLPLPAGGSVLATAERP